MSPDPEQVLTQIFDELNAFHELWIGDDDAVQQNAESAISTLAEIQSLISNHRERSSPISDFYSSRFGERL